MVFSASGIYADREFQSSFYFLKKELLWVTLGLLGLALAYCFPLKSLQMLAPLIFLGALGLVLLTHTPLGVKVGGATRWIQLGFSTLQPSEFMKIALVLLLAAYFDWFPKAAEYFWVGVAFPLALASLAIVPVLIQPDLGTSMMMGAVTFLILFVSGVRFRYLLGLAASGIPVLFYCIIQFPYRLRRIFTFLDPWKDPQGSGFQIVQSFLAIGKGGLSGVGLGESTQKLFYLPEAHTDFIFSILAEELGFIGSVSVILTFLIFTVAATRVALHASDRFGHLCGVGFCSMISLQALFNIAVVTGTVPTKGIPLPFISFGGSNMIMNLMVVGLLLNIAKHSEQSKEKLKREKMIPSKTPANRRFSQLRLA
jgi:cell division protein FtsW